VSGYTEGHKVSEINIQQTSIQVGTQSVISDIFRVSLGTAAEFYHFGKALGSVDSSNINNDTYINYFLRGTLDQLDNANFPHSGWAMDGIIRVVTDNGWSYNGNRPFAMFALKLKLATKISDRVVLLPSLNSQISLNSDVPLFYRSYIGGFQKTNYFGNYLPFAGLKRMEISADNVAYAALDIRVRMWEKIYTSFISNFGLYTDGYNSNHEVNLMLGAGISAAYDSVMGPVELVFSTSNLNRNLIAYFSLGYSF
jgi:NTE family protein